MKSNHIIDHDYPLFRRGIRLLSDLPAGDREFLYKYRDILFPNPACITSQHVRDIDGFAENETTSIGVGIDLVNNIAIHEAVQEEVNSGEHTAGGGENGRGGEGEGDVMETMDEEGFSQMGSCNEEGEKTVNFDDCPYMVYYNECRIIILFLPNRYE